ncbi:DUF523 and DUF1722 domain-containing protein [Halobacteriovorax sp. HLS]|uniref:YbgA family protein n=1 Tax=Halobacteriovorax sp. HLS TaxID=2234000 RepID=UPI000FDC7BD2|nr:DUF523 and DUF1722 domain-containing protein [Halobacteriovorax sp. HLS]
MKDKPKIGISSCLLGNNVRYNKGHTRDSWIVNELGKYVDFYPICPEVEMGLGVPREEIYLNYEGKNKNSIKIRGRKSHLDYTDLANETYKSIAPPMALSELDGFIFMRKSPSCGTDNVKTVEVSGDGPVTFNTGLFAKFVIDFFPNLPYIDSGRMNNSQLRENFMKRVFASFRFKNLNRDIASLQDFHKRYKYILMEHSPANLKTLGNLAAGNDMKDIELHFDQYEKIFQKSLEAPPTQGGRFNVLQHIMGYLKRDLSKEEKVHILNLFEDYKKNYHLHAVPKSLFEFFIAKFNVTYLQDHYYFNPYPKELKIHQSIA